ncbi:LysR family transcriptional regulator [uncultured Veillonella sp.]|uniref:LysR family transcriptional regulator n=1 Tax=uncultured Veillonella sp. TaxID=159268 RepID=UPI0025E0E13D|nr:LysR family transcriptional regulator [uncultured Veillonella sp.]
MTLLQLKYVVAVANCGSMNKAAKELFIAQPSLTAAIKELEQELGITIFSRTNKGVVLSADGEEFLGYARQVMEQTTLIEEKYFGQPSVKHQFCVSTQHYSFAVEAFVDVLKSYGGNEYDFRIRETQTYEIIEDVAKLRSEIGILYLNEYNETILRKEFKHYDLTFHRLFLAKPHVFVSSSSPLAKQDVVKLEDLDPYPRLSYEQGSHNSFYFSEEVLSTIDRPKDIVVCDRATLFNLLIGLNGYTLCSGVISEKLNGPNILAIPLDVEDHMEIGYILHNKVAPGKYCQLYIDALKRNTSDQI